MADDLGVFGANQATYVLDGTDISRWVTKCDTPEEDQTVDFHGSGGAPTVVVPLDVKNTGSMTVAVNGTTWPLIRRLERSQPKPIVNLVITDYLGAEAETLPIQVMKATRKRGSGAVAEMDVDFNVIGALPA